MEGQAEGVVDPVEADLLGPTVERMTSEVRYVPRDAGGAAEDRRIAALAAVLAVRRHVRAKRASMRAHASQSSNDGSQSGDRTLAAFLRIPRPLYDVVFGREWFRDPTAVAADGIRTDIFEGLP